jgi:hypothetical protein
MESVNVVVWYVMTVAEGILIKSFMAGALSR